MSPFELFDRLASEVYEMMLVYMHEMRLANKKNLEAELSQHGDQTLAM